jgi:hypothetical protein
MRAPTEKLREWLWFAALWCCGLAATFLLAQLTRWVVSIG